MAERDVKLVIRAKNEAKRTIDSVADALKTLDDAQKSVSSSASKTDGLIGRLGQEFAKLNAQISATAAIEKVAQHLNKAGEAVKGLQQNLVGAEKRLGELGAASKAAANNTADLERQQAALAAQVKSDKAAMDAAASAVNKRSAAQKELTKATAEYNKAVKQPADRAGRDDAVLASKTRLDAAKAAVEANRQAHESLQNAYAKSSSALKRMNGDVNDAQKNYNRLKSELADTVAQIGRSQGELSRANKEFGELKTIADSASKSMGNFTRTQRDAVAATGQLAPQVERLSTLMKTLGHYSTGDGGFDTGAQAAAMRKQVEAVDAARARYATLRSEIERLNTQIRSSGGATTQQAQELRTLSSAANAAEREVKELSGALKQLQASGNGAGFLASMNRESRQAMWIMQRLRGEVLALATAYVGLYGAISNSSSVVKSFQTMEAAQNRLGAVMKQDTAAVGREIGWLERQANRLGIEFGGLADEYSKFAVAAQGANFSMEGTRTVFMRVAEAGRVNKLSMEEMKLIFLALQQMISKGAIQSEELKQQLGERLPGAFNIMADAMGITTAEMMKMMEKGELLANESNMLKFATELDKRFGSQLATSLRSTTTEIGRFQNNMYQAQLLIANGGFIEAFTNGLKEMNKWFATDEGREFFLSIGAAAGKAIDVFVALAGYSDQLLSALQALIAVKLASWLMSFAGNIGRAVNDMRSLTSATEANTVATNFATSSTKAMSAAVAAGSGHVLTMARSAAASVAQLGAAGAAAKGLGIAVSATGTKIAAVASWSTIVGTLTSALNLAKTSALALMAAFGGPAGIAVAVGSYFAIDYISGWISGVDEATSALEKHRTIMNQVLTDYEAMDPATRNWAKALESVSLVELDRNSAKLKKNFDDLFTLVTANRTNPLAAWQGGWGELSGDIDKARDALKRGDKTAKEYQETLEKMYAATTNAGAKEYLGRLIDEATELAKLEKASREAADAADKKRDASNGVKDAAKGAAGALDEMAASANATADSVAKATESAAEYEAALAGIKGMIPEVAAEMKRLKSQLELDEYVNKLGMGPRTKEEIEYINAAQKHLDLSVVAEGIRDAVAMVVKYEGWQPTGKWDVNAYRAGYGSDTVTLDDGSIVAITKGMAVNRADANRDLARRLSTEFIPGIKKSIGLENFNALTKQQQAVLASLAYNYGSLPERVAKVIRGGGSTEDIVKAIDALKNDNPEQGRPNFRRRQEEAQLFGSGADSDKAIRAAEKRVELEKKAAEGTRQRIEDQKFEISQQDLKNVGKEREAAIEAAIRAEKKANPGVGEKELAVIREQTAALFDKQQLKKAEKEENKAVKDAMKEVNNLESQRNALIAQRKVYQDTGNTDKVKEISASIEGVNVQLQEAIDKAIAMYKALGGTEADAAIAKLDTTKLAIANAKNETIGMRQSVEELSTQFFNIMEGGIVNAFDALAQAIANGEDAGKAFGQAMQQMFAQLLIELGKAIIKQIMYNSLLMISKSLGGMFGGGGLLGGLFHSGGIVGASTRSTKGRPAELWSNAVRYHSGGIAGLAPREVPAILEKGEEVLTADDPRHANNLGRGGSESQQQASPNRVKILNMFDAGSFLSEAMASAKGEETILNFIRNNPAAVKQAIG